MLNTKYLNNCNKIKKNVIKMFIPLLFSFKNNKLTKTFYIENMYYKIFYLIYSHISVIKVFFKDKKIFYNFSKYFQINLYIYLIKKKLMILNLFFYFFYTLFLTFENLEDISTNHLFFRGYKHRLKYETFLKGWIKPDHSLKFYFLQRINSISLYVLNFNIYKNFYFSKYNLFLIDTKLIYKLFYYFKILQYKLQSFVILYRSFYKCEKKIRLIFAQTNCRIYKHLNNKLILFFSLYKNFLTKNTQTKTNFSVTSLVSKNNQLKKKIHIKPIYNSNKIASLLRRKKKILKLNILKKLKNYFLANYVFNFFFKINFNFSYFNLFYNNILKLNWLKNNFLKNKSYYKKIFMNFFIKFLMKYSISTKLMRRYDINNKNYFYSIVDSFINKLKKTIIIFLINFFNLSTLSEKVKLNFIDFILDKFKFNLLFKTVYNFKPVSLQTFYLIIFNIFEQFVFKNFESNDFYINLNINQNVNKKNLFVQQFFLFNYKNITNDITNDYLFSLIHFQKYLKKCLSQYSNFFYNLIRNKFSNYVLSINDLPDIIYYLTEYKDKCKIFKEYFEIHFKKKNSKKKKKFNQKFSIKLINELKKIRLKKKQKQDLTQILKKKLKKSIIKRNFFKILKLNLNFLKKVKIKTLWNYNIAARYNHKNFFFYSIKKKIFKRLIQKNNKKKLKFLKLEKLNLKKNKYIYNKNLKQKLFKVIKTEKIKQNKLNNQFVKFTKYDNNNNYLRYTNKYQKYNNNYFKYNNKYSRHNSKYQKYNNKYQRYDNKYQIYYNNYQKSNKKKKMNLKFKIKKLKNEKKKLKKTIKKLLKKKIIKIYIKFLKKNKKKIIKNLKKKIIKKYGNIFLKKYNNQIIKNYKKNLIKNYKKKFIKNYKKKKIIKKYKKKLIKNYKNKLIQKYGYSFLKKNNKNKKKLYKNELIKKYGNFFEKRNKKISKNKKIKKVIKNKKIKKVIKNKKIKKVIKNKKIKKVIKNKKINNLIKKNICRGKIRRRKQFRKRFHYMKLNAQKTFGNLFFSLKKPLILKKMQYFLTKLYIRIITKNVVRFVSKKFIKIIFFKKNNFNKFLNLKYFNKNKLKRKRFLFNLKYFNTIKWKFITKKKKKTYIKRFFNYYRKYKKKIKRIKKQKQQNQPLLVELARRARLAKEARQFFAQRNRRLDEQIRRNEQLERNVQTHNIQLKDNTKKNNNFKKNNTTKKKTILKKNNNKKKKTILKKKSNIKKKTILKKKSNIKKKTILKKKNNKEKKIILKKKNNTKKNNNRKKNNNLKKKNNNITKKILSEKQKLILKKQIRKKKKKILERKLKIMKKKLKIRKKIIKQLNNLKKIMKKLKKNDKNFYKKIKRKIIKKYGFKKFEKNKNKFINKISQQLKRKLIRKYKHLRLRLIKKKKKKNKKKFFKKSDCYLDDNNNKNNFNRSNKFEKIPLKLKKTIKIKISPFNLYHNKLQFFKKKIIKLRKFDTFKKKKIILKKLNRKKILLYEIANNYFKKLYQFYFELKKKYFTIKNKITLLKINSNKLQLVIMNQLNQELQRLKRKLNYFNKKIITFKLEFKSNLNFELQHNLKFKKKFLKNNVSLKKKNYFKKKPFFLKTKFFEINVFKLVKSTFFTKKLYVDFFFSPRYKEWLKKFKCFMKSAYFKRLINYQKHYKRFLEIKKRIKKDIKFKINPFLIKKGFHAFLKLMKHKKLKRKVKIKSKRVQKKSLLLKYDTKLMNITLKLLKLNNQNNFLNKLKSELIYLKNLKNNNLLKIAKLNILKLKIIKKKKLKLKKLKKKNSNIKLKKILKKKIFLLINLIKKRKNLFFFFKKTNNVNLIKINIIKLNKLQLKLNKLKLKLNKLILNKLTLNKLIKIKILPLLLKKKKKIKQVKLKKKIEQMKLKKKIKQVKLKNERNLSQLAIELTEKVVKKLSVQHKLANEKLLQDDLIEMKKVKDLKKRDDERYFNVKIKKNATTFGPKIPYKQIQKRHTYRVQKYYRDRQKRLKLCKQHKDKYRIPHTKKQKFFFAQKLLYLHEQIKKVKAFDLEKYSYFFNILIQARLNLFKLKKIRNEFNFFFLNKLKHAIKNILFKNKSSYYNLIKSSLNGMNFYNEYKLWHLHFIKLKKIPFNLIRLYAKFYFNKILYNLKLKSTFFCFYYNYLKSCTKIKYFKIKQIKKVFKKKKVRRLAQIIFYKSFKSYMKYFVASKNVIFSLIKNGSFYMYYKLHEISRFKSKKDSTVSLFLTNLKNKRSFYVSKSTSYSNFFFIYWAHKFYGYKTYGKFDYRFDEFNILTNYFKFFKSKTFFFNYLINFIFSYIQKINLDVLNYVFILNQYKTKLIIDSNNFYKYLILFYFKRNQYLNFFIFNKDSNFIMPRYFSFFSLFFKNVSIELSNWYSLINNSFLNGYQSTFLFKLCFINHNTNAVYLHYKYKYLYYYRVYNFYIFYIFYYLYNHLFKVYKKLKLKEFKLSYDLIKYNEYNRYYLGLRTRMLILTIRNRYKRGFTVEKIFKNIKFFLRESRKKKELAGYYISIRGRYKRSSRSNKLILKRGVYSFNKIDLKIDSAYGTLNTKYGIAGIKVIFAFK